MLERSRSADRPLGRRLPRRGTISIEREVAIGARDPGHGEKVRNRPFVLVECACISVGDRAFCAETNGAGHGGRCGTIHDVALRGGSAVVEAHSAAHSGCAPMLLRCYGRQCGVPDVEASPARNAPRCSAQEKEATFVYTIIARGVSDDVHERCQRHW